MYAPGQHQGTSGPKLSAKYLVIPAFILPPPCQQHKKTITWLFCPHLLTQPSPLPGYECWTCMGRKLDLGRTEMFGEQAYGEQIIVGVGRSMDGKLDLGRIMGSKLDLEANARLKCLAVRWSRHLLRRSQPPFNANYKGRKWQWSNSWLFAPIFYLFASAPAWFMVWMMSMAPLLYPFISSG